VVATSSAELSYAASSVFGLRFRLDVLDTLIEELRAGKRPGELLTPPALDAAGSREVQLRRFRHQAVRAAEQTAYYGDLFAQVAVEPDRLTWDELAALPITRKEPLRERPDDFVCRDVEPVFRTTTTGTTGKPTSVCFSDYEMQLYFRLYALGNLLRRDEVLPDDIVMIGSSARALLGNLTCLGGCARIGAQAFASGIVDAELALRMLTEERRVAGKRPRVSFLLILASYLGEIVEAGLRLGYRPADFGLKRIDVSGEVGTEGLKRRARKLFGDVAFAGGYGATETWPTGCDPCEQGHFHFAGPSDTVEMGGNGLIEVLEPDTGRPAGPGEVGTLVITPFAPYRECTLFLRYDTEDMVRVPAEPAKCSQRHRLATSPVLGKRRLAVRHDDGWTFPRDVLEALEAVDAVPLPARCGFWAADGGVAVEVVPRRHTAAARRAIEESLEAHRVPLRELHLRETPEELERQLPLRCDLRETTFSAPVPTRAVEEARPTT
jgi:phenylacetate-coenzyme A ligase PaaK-like adenylate-forming protein